MVRRIFIPKLETKNYLLGSFEACLQETRELILENAQLDAIKEEKPEGFDSYQIVDKHLSTLPTLFRAAITTKEYEYVGYIALTNINYARHSTHVVIEGNEKLSSDAVNEILAEYLDFAYDSLNLTLVYTVEIKTKSDKIVRVINTEKEVETLNISTHLLDTWFNVEYIEKMNEDHNLVVPCAMLEEGKPIGIIGLTNVNYPNKRAQIQTIFEDGYVENEKIGEYIQSYTYFVKDYGIPDAICIIPASNKVRIDSIEGTSFSYFGCIPYAHKNDNGEYESLLIYHNAYSVNNYILEKYRYDKAKDKTVISKPKDRIEINNKFTLVAPSTLEGHILEKAARNHALALNDRKNFSIPLGEDKYFPQIGCENYGIYKAISHYTYLIMGKDNKYIGFINILRQNGKNIEIEIGIKPHYQNQGIGTLALSTFYDEMFRIGYYSVTSSVFSFNKISRHMHEKLAENTAIKINSYYAYGRLWDMYIYTKINPNI